METQDKINKAYQSAAKNAETKDFPAMDKVWQQLENKLNNKQLTKENTLWKKLTVAASILFVVSIGYQFIKKDKTSITPTNTVATIDTTKTVTNNVSNEAIVTKEANINPAIKSNAKTILQEQISTKNQVAITDTLKRKVPKMVVTVIDSKIKKESIQLQKPIATPSLGAQAYDSNDNSNKQKDNSRGVRQDVGYLNYSGDAKESKQTSKKEAPLYVIDDKVSNNLDIGKLDPNEIDSILVLPDPLYIINGLEFTEKELFGPNPTSPYAPLNKQNIETLSILQNEKATEVYGEKGKKGVVIIATKGGKPATQKK